MQIAMDLTTLDRVELRGVFDDLAQAELQRTAPHVDIALLAALVEEELFITFAQECGALTKAQGQGLLGECWGALIEERWRKVVYNTVKTPRPASSR
jgi:hypothetical protein